MSAATSPATGKIYGVERTCLLLGYSRSTFYEKRFAMNAAPALVMKRGPIPAVSDQELLAAIRADLKASPFSGEGHRKVWARLRVRDQIRVGRKRVLRLMRENKLLSPHRRPVEPKLHDGEIITNAPNIMWGTDGVRIFTVEDGWVWLFAAIEHWNAECMGWFVTKHGTRFAALEPIKTALERTFGAAKQDVGRGLMLRMDHGPQYLSDHFLNQVRFWGLAPSFAFVDEPQTNGVAERFNRTLKEQAIFGRVFNNTEEVRAAVAKFVALYNNHWLVEKLGFRSPLQARQEWGLRNAA